jgi:hypothetical protein
MATNPLSKPSFSPRSKWGIGLQVTLNVAIMLAVVVMINYLGHDYFTRGYWSTRTKIELHPRTLSLLKSITNDVRVTLYYDKNDDLYGPISDLLQEYHLANPKVSIQTVDYLRDPGAAEKVAATYKLPAKAKNLVIFDCEGGHSPPLKIQGDALATSQLQVVTNRDPESAGLPRFLYRRQPIAFKGEMMFSSFLLAITSPKPLNAYFLEGHGEARIEDTDTRTGYSKFADLLQMDYIRVRSLTDLQGTNPIPADCDLLVIGGPKTDIPDEELAKIDQYLARGGRLFAMFNADSKDEHGGLEKILAKWGVAVGQGVVEDPENSSSKDHSDVVVSAYSFAGVPAHPVVNPLAGYRLYLVRPRPVGRLATPTQRADAPVVDEIAYSSQKAFLQGRTNQVGNFPLMVAVEKGAIPGVAEHGARLIVVGDSLFLANQQLELTGVKNRDFVDYAANWLLDRTQVLNGPGPQPIDEYKIVMSNAQLQSAQWVLLVGMPGAVLFLGGLVWLRRRK